MPSPERIDVPRQWREVLQEERIAHLIKAAFRGTSAGLQRRLREHDVLYGHWTFLRILWQTDGLTQRQLSEQAGVTEPSAVNALQAMEKLGYLTRRKIEGNNKQIRVFVAPKGKALRTRVEGCAHRVNQLSVAGIPAEDLAATRRTLLAVIENLQRDSVEATGRRKPEVGAASPKASRVHGSAAQVAKATP